jgi:Flp pilus assembly protein TadB
MRLLQWQTADETRGRRLSRHPYRDVAILHAVLAAVVVAVALITRGGIVRGVAIAACFWALATGWSWWRLRTRTPGEGDG